jgi:hypothetical protein
LLSEAGMNAWQRSVGCIVLTTLAFGSNGCAFVGPIDARDAWSARGEPLTESMLPPPASSSTADRAPSYLGLLRALFGIGVALGRGHTACGPNDDACAARLRSAPIHAGDWQNRFPTL